MTNPLLAEFIGTAMILLLGGGVNASVTLFGSYSKGGGWLMVCMGWSLGVTLAIYAAGAASGAHLNPAVTIAFALREAFPWDQVPGYIFAQLAGAFTGSTLMFLQFLPHWGKTEDKAAKLGIFSTAPAIPNTIGNLISEIIGTFVLVIGLLFLGTNTFTDGLNPLVVGALILAIGLSLGGTTGFAINPARDLGPRLAHALLPIPGKGDSNWSYSWIPVVGPILGAVMAVVVFNLIS
ncbi:MAG: aquaporin family protein [Bacteroidetes bacterium]|nr:aquaporin family protein [Bacteroidota bacterium]